MNRIKTISIVLLTISVIILLIYSLYLNKKYDVNEHIFVHTKDSLNKVIELECNRYDSLKIISDSLYEKEINENDSLHQLILANYKNNKTKITYIYKDSTIIKEAEDIQLESKIETVVETRYIEKEIVKTVHDTTYITKRDTLYKENTIQVSEIDSNENKVVSKNTDLFNLYLDGNVGINLDVDVIPDVSVGMMFKELFYVEAGINYNEKVNPNAKIGIRWKIY